MTKPLSFHEAHRLSRKLVGRLAAAVAIGAQFFAATAAAKRFQSPAINPSPQRIFRTPGNPRSRRMASRPSVLRARSVSRFGGILRCEGDKFRFDHRTRLDNIF